MADNWTYWQNAINGKFGPVHDGDAQTGFYRKRQKDGPFLPVAIFEHEGKMVALQDGKPTDAAAIWSWVCDKPVTEAAYKQAMAGKGWPDDPPPVLRNTSDDPHEALSQEYAGEVEQAKEFLAKPITTKEQADMAAVWSKRLAAISTRATTFHKAEKQPHLDAGRVVDDKWRDLKDGPAEWSKRLKRHLDTWLLEEQRKEQERQRLAREEADRIRREAEEAARAAAFIGDAETAAEAERLEQEAVAAAKDAEARNASAGRTGAKVSLRTFTFAEIVDFDALLIALKDRAEIKEVVETLANRAARSGVQLPGMAIKQEQRAA